ncbi:hypothetical protein ACR31S_03540 [Streptococcus iniae]
MPLSQESAEEIANKWHYQPPYDFYDMTADIEDYKEILSADKEGIIIFRFFAMGFFLALLASLKDMINWK